MKTVYLILASFAFAACASQPSVQHEASNQEGRTVASSFQFGYPVSLNECGGDITLNQSKTNDLAIVLHNTNNSRCNRLTVSDHSSGRIISSYSIKGTSYTLSKNMLEGLSDDCQVDFEMSGYQGADRFIVYIPWCVPHTQSVSTGVKSYQLSEKGNCKLLVNGAYSGKNTDASYCTGANNKRDVVSYEYSKNHNCKRMVNGDYTNVNVDESFCQ